MYVYIDYHLNLLSVTGLRNIGWFVNTMNPEQHHIEPLPDQQPKKSIETKKDQFDTRTASSSLSALNQAEPVVANQTNENFAKNTNLAFPTYDGTNTSNQMDVSQTNPSIERPPHNPEAPSKIEVANDHGQANSQTALWA